MWTIYYWGAFVLNWTLIPFTVGYLEAGDFTRLGKSCTSLKVNAPWYALWALIFGVICMILYLTDSGKQILTAGGGLEGVLIGLTLIAGLIWLSLTLGYGMVKIPIRFYANSSLESRLNYFQYKVAYYDDQMHELLYIK